MSRVGHFFLFSLILGIFSLTSCTASYATNWPGGPMVSDAPLSQAVSDTLLKKHNDDKNK